MFIKLFNLIKACTLNIVMCKVKTVKACVLIKMRVPFKDKKKLNVLYLLSYNSIK